MKQIILLILFVLGGMCFAESDPLAESSYKTVTVYQKLSDGREISVPINPSDYKKRSLEVDSVKYYESLATQYREAGENLLKNNSRQKVIGGLLAFAGVCGFAVTLSQAGNRRGSLEGGGVANAALLIIQVGLSLGATLGGLAIFPDGIKYAEGQYKIQKSEEYQKKADEHREKEKNRQSSQMMLQVVPEINPFNKTFGAKLALSI